MRLDPCVRIRVDGVSRVPTPEEVEARAAYLRGRLSDPDTGTQRDRSGWIRELFHLGYEYEANGYWDADPKPCARCCAPTGVPRQDAEDDELCAACLSDMGSAAQPPPETAA